MDTKKLFILSLMVLGVLGQTLSSTAQEDCDGQNDTCHKQCSKDASDPSKPTALDNLPNCWDDCDQKNQQCLGALGM